MKKTKFYIGICLIVQCVCFAIAALILSGREKKGLAKALGITAGIGGVSGIALITIAMIQKKKQEECCDDCLEDFDDDFFVDDEDEVFCTVDDEDATEEVADELE